MQRAVAVAGTRRPRPPLSLLPRPGAGTRREVPEPPRLRPPVAEPARDRGRLGLRPLGAGYRRRARPDRGDARGVLHAVQPGDAGLLTFGARDGIRGARRGRDT